MSKMQAAEAMVKILEDEGVEVIFGIPGAGILPFYSALRKSGEIKHYLARHEEGASHAADGYARSTGKVGICVGTSGPAGTNFVTGLYAAQVDFDGGLVAYAAIDHAALRMCIDFFWLDGVGSGHARHDRVVCGQLL